jgi:hypothetical protein
VREQKASALSSIDGFISDVENAKAQVFDLIYNSKDEVFHHELYSWLINMNMSSELLNVG